ncbi:MAG: hypothetical protein KJ655_04180 [Candidatus Thermoplasmatota archaeon]|nr:hypothetical protein [Candidatus Thermoplasmatota archaeon]
MAIYTEKGDGIKGEVLVAFFRKLRSVTTIAGSRHRQQRAKLVGTPAVCYINKEVRSLEKQ